MDSVVTLVNNYVAGAARSAVDAFDIERSSGIDDAAWWAATGPWLAKVFDAERYPVAARAGTTTGQHYQAVSDPDHAFEFGLQRVLDGVEVLVRSRGERQHRAGSQRVHQRSAGSAAGREPRERP